MKVAALVSGGKDSCYSMMECEKYGHEIVVLGNLYSDEEEVDSFMFQSVGSRLVQVIADCMDVPLVSKRISGTAISQDLHYAPTEGDEVEDLYELLKEIKAKYPQVEAVCSGAVFSTYQRIRVENVCQRLGLCPLAYLWRKEQSLLLREMIEAGVEAILVKVASIGLDPKKHLGKSIAQLEPYFHSLHEKYQFHVCGEGGEYETITLNCPLFKRRIVVDETKILMHSDDMFAPVGLLQVVKSHTEGETLASQALNIRFKGFRRQFHSHGISAKHFDGDVVEETHHIFRSLREALKQKGLDLADVVFVHIFLKDMSHFKLVNGVYCQYFGENPASRSCVQAQLTDSNVLVDCFAEKDSGKSKLTETSIRQVLHVKSISTWAPTCIGPYSQANVMRSAIIFCAGQIGLVPETMAVIEGGVAAEIKQTFKSAARVFDALNSNLKHVIGGVVYTTERQTDLLTEFVRPLLCSNADEPDVFEDEYNSDESDDEVDKEAEHLMLALHSPLLQVIVDRLPRDVAVEAELISFCHKARRVFQINCERHSNSELSYSDRMFLIAAYVIEIDLGKEAQAAELFLDFLKKALTLAGLTFDQLLHLRVFVTPQFESFADHLKLPQVVAISTIPVRQVQGIRTGQVAIQALAQDLDAIEAEMWLRKLI